MRHFLLVGCIATVIQYAILICVTRACAAPPVLASAIGFVVSAIANYMGNYYYTFGSNERHELAVAKFAILAALGLALNSVLMHFLVAAGLYYLLAQLVTTIVVLAWNFTGHSLWTYRDGSGRYSVRALLARNKDLIIVVLLAAAVRALVFLLSNNEPGDADARVLASERWALNPTFIRSGVWLPLHFYATGVLSWLLGDPISAGKTLSFVTGSATAIPLFRLAELLFDRRTAVISGLFFAVYGLHVELSSVVMSEAPCALLLLCGLYVFLREIRSVAPRIGMFLLAALLLALAGGFRQEPWLLTGALSVYLLWKPQFRRFAVPFGLVGLSTLIAWDIANAFAGKGDFNALFAVAHAKATEARYREFSALQNVLKWFWIFVKSPGLAISLWMAAGWALAARRQSAWELALISLALIAPFAALSVIKPEWAPQDRYTVFVGLLSLPYAAAAIVAMVRKISVLRLVVVATLTITVVNQMGIYLWRFHGPLPVPQYDANDVAVWNWMAANAPPASYVIVEDTEWRSPGLIAHSALYDHPYRIVYSFRGPENLQEAIAQGSGPLLLVLHSPLSKWQFLERFHKWLVYQNPDYQVIRAE